MAYIIIPNAGDKLKISQGQIQTNFSDLKNTFDVNHVALTGLGGDEGKHKFLQMPDQGAAPAVGATEYTLYSALFAAANNQRALFAQRGGSTDKVPFTAGTLPSGIFTTSAINFALLGSGLMIKFGVQTQGNINGLSTVPYDISIQDANQPDFTNIGGAWLTILYNGVQQENLITSVDYTNTTVTTLKALVRNQSVGAFVGGYRLGWLVFGTANLT